MKKVFSILDEKPNLSKKGEQFPDNELEQTVEFDNVSFSYGRENVLHSVSFSINKCFEYCTVRSRIHNVVLQYSETGAAE